MHRLLTASLVALLVVGLMPLAVLAGVPEVDSQSVSTNEDTALPITLTATESSGVDVTAFTPGTPDHGAVVPSGSIQCDAQTPDHCSQEFTYTPQQDYNGSDSFTFTATSDGAPSVGATISITVDPVNDDPTFTVGSDVTVDEESGSHSDLTFIADGSAGPADESGQTLTYTVVAADTALFSSQPAISSSGGLTFTPALDAFGTTSVSVDLDDGAGGASGSQSFDITIDNVNDAPGFTKGPDVQVALDNPGYDAAWATGISAGPGESDSVSFVVLAQDPSLFSVVPAVDATGHLTFTPDGTSPGSTSVTVKAVDDGTPPAESPQQTFAITIFDGTSAIAQSVSVDEDTTGNAITLTGFDPEDDPLTFELASQPAHGELSGTAPDLTYKPDLNFFGTDTFSFTVTDGVNTSSAATVTITVANVNDPVLARFDQVGVKATTTTVLDVFKANPTNADSAGPGEPISEVTITSIPVKPGKGTATITNGGTRITYDPSGCATGTDSFQYTISDGPTFSTATVTVTIKRPGAPGVSSIPLTDTPAVGFITNSTMATTVPMKLSWCGVTTSTSSVRSYRVLQSTNGGSTYPTTLFSSTTVKSSTRDLSVNKDYRWKAKTTDTAGRAGNYRSSLVSRLTRYQDTHVAIAYTGTWATSKTTNASSGSERYTTQTGAAATITVTNVRAFAIIGPKSSTRGSFKVFVDGTLVKTVSEHATSLVYRRVLYARSVTSGSGVSHTIRIESAGSARVDLDAIVTLK